MAYLKKCAKLMWLSENPSVHILAKDFFTINHLYWLFLSRTKPRRFNKGKFKLLSFISDILCLKREKSTFFFFDRLKKKKKKISAKENFQGNINYDKQENKYSMEIVFM